MLLLWLHQVTIKLAMQIRYAVAVVAAFAFDKAETVSIFENIPGISATIVVAKS